MRVFSLASLPLLKNGTVRALLGPVFVYYVLLFLSLLMYCVVCIRLAPRVECCVVKCSSVHESKSVWHVGINAVPVNYIAFAFLPMAINMKDMVKGGKSQVNEAC